jgi:transcriptional regulator with XRE-family HTH domain
MRPSRKSAEEAKELGESLRDRRKNCGLTLQIVSAATSVDVGQLSRFERGEFRDYSENLQKFVHYLQKCEKRRRQTPDDLVGRFVDVVARSARHEAAARALVMALERLQ